MTADTALIIVAALFLCAAYVGFRFAVLAHYYRQQSSIADEKLDLMCTDRDAWKALAQKLQPKRGARGRWVAK